MSNEAAQARCDIKRLILASSSPRRRELLEARGYHVKVVVPPLKEPSAIDRDLPPAQLAQALSYFKAESVGRSIGSGFVLAGDTIAALGHRVFGKPRDRMDAASILSTLSGTTHNVITGVTLLDIITGERSIRHETTAVTLRRLTADQLETYLESNAWVGKAGAFGIQDREDPFVERIEGSYTNVVGFPMELIETMLGEWGISA